VFELAKFALNFEILTRESDEVSHSGNPFAEKPRLITTAALWYGLRGQHRPDGYRPYPKQQQALAAAYGENMARWPGAMSTSRG
jgi:hypothetical protein